MKGFFGNIEKLTLENNNFRKVLYTAQWLQLVLMALQPNEEIDFEVHKENDQFFRFESGSGKVYIDDTIYDVADDDVVVIPRGSRHNVIAWSQGLKMYTLYGPAHHKDGVTHPTKEFAETQEELWNDDFDGSTTE